MRILKILSRFLICILCIGVLCANSYADDNFPNAEAGADYAEVFNPENLEKINSQMSSEAEEFQKNFTSNLQSSDFVPFEVRIGLMFMKALSAMAYVLKFSLVRFTIIFLLIMYAFWIMLEAYKMIRDASPYKDVLYNIFMKGMVIAIWLVILNYGVDKLFADIISPILALGTHFSNFILNTVAESHGITMYDTCTSIHKFVNENGVTLVANNQNAKLLLEPDAAANIMCLPGCLSVYFYHATGTALKWFVWGFGRSATAVVMGGICAFIFIKCIFKYAFMTLSVVADLFLTLLMLPFTALAEALPPNAEKSYVGKMLDGFLSMFSTKKVSDVLSVFINATVFFISLSIIIAICASLLSYIMPADKTYLTFSTQTAMMNILCGCLVLYLAGKAEELAKKIGGSINNSFGEGLQNDAKTFWGGTKNVAGKIFKDWIKK